MLQFKEEMKRMAEIEGREIDEEEEAKLMAGYGSGDFKPYRGESIDHSDGEDNPRASLAVIPFTGVKETKADKIRNIKALR